MNILVFSIDQLEAERAQDGVMLGLSMMRLARKIDFSRLKLGRPTDYLSGAERKRA